ncbi:MAG TPA: hypothetical protein VMQ51_07055 [Candidatus Binatia bacterium]|nr:hypothetical protein [Candidatus Binatia bacterium]
MTRPTATLALALSLLTLAAATAAAHDEAKTKIDPTMLLDLTAPKETGPNRAFDESIKRDPPAPAKTEWKPQPDGSYRYGNTTIFIRHDCPPGSEFYEPPPLPGRRR